MKSFHQILHTGMHSAQESVAMVLCNAIYAMSLQVIERFNQDNYQW